VIKLSKILSEVMIKTSQQNLNEYESVLFADVLLFQELANPNHSYTYQEIEPNLWEFQDKYLNTIQLEYFPSVKYINTQFVVNDKDGVEFISFDIDKDKDRIAPFTFHHNKDERRSDTIAKIILDEIVPKYLINKSPQILKIAPIDIYRYKIFYKIAELIKEKYPQLEIQEKGDKKEIWMLNK